MKRLKHYLLNMNLDNSTYNELYNGNMFIPTSPPTIFDSSTYWDYDIGYSITRSNKHELDKPTVTIHIPTEKIGVDTLTIAAADYILRYFKRYIDELNELNYNRLRPDEENGKYLLYNPDGVVLFRNTAFWGMVVQRSYEYVGGNSKNGYQVSIPDHFNDPPKMCINIMLQIQLPNKKHRKAIQMLTKDLPKAVMRFISGFSMSEINASLALSEQQEAIRQWLKSSNYCAFIANGSILPRYKYTDLPFESAIPFQSPPEDEIEILGIKGMGIKRGVTVITGGGYSGKSTLLDAISAGIYNHVLNDGRELVITDDTGIKISAEDGRSVKNVNISPFIKWLPQGDTYHFSTEHASGSTSQAANIMEYVNYGSKLILIDEDKSATNFMIRDRIMKALIEKEPITPFTDRINELYEKNDVSTILVIGGSSEYLSVADKVYMMQDYLISDVTSQAKNLCASEGIVTERPFFTEWQYKRALVSEGFSSYPKGSGTEKLSVSDMGIIYIGDERIDVRMLHNIVSTPQLNAIGFIIRKLQLLNKENSIDIESSIDKLYENLAKDGLDSVFSSFFVNCGRWLDLPRKFEVLAVINRMRNINFISE